MIFSTTFFPPLIAKSGTDTNIFENFDLNSIGDCMDMVAIKNSHNETEFKNKLKETGVNTVIRRNASERIYGITFIDHQSKSVWNGYRLGKEFSANAFNQIWSENINQKEQINNDDEKQNTVQDNSEISNAEKPHKLFDFLNDNSDSKIDRFGSILPESQGEDYEELDFESRMKMKKRRIRKNK